MLKSLSGDRWRYSGLVEVIPPWRVTSSIQTVMSQTTDWQPTIVTLEISSHASGVGYRCQTLLGMGLCVERGIPDGDLLSRRQNVVHG